jgi:hypothetical protein
MSRVPGPDVFFNCTATGTVHVDAGPHERWAAGVLYDNISIPGGLLEIENRSWMGSGQGWAGANSVLWNSTAKDYTVENPPTAQNWAVGIKGALTTPVDKGKTETILDNGQTVMLSLADGKTTTSLYEAQLAARLN